MWSRASSVRGRYDNLLIENVSMRYQVEMEMQYSGSTKTSAARGRIGCGLLSVGAEMVSLSGYLLQRGMPV
jgi:hypothetical protein